ncbi:hypothetical protein RS030_81372 [Cryptosporidium xiaoi]|uniref:Uncharacterized protein n=1 Tax=Cryptosporidium xiaoi TaxID=659607 RepID=A0AAV9XSM8_9CRYT
MNNLCIKQLKKKINKTGFNWEKSVKNIEDLLDSVKMNIKSNIKRKKVLNNEKLVNENEREPPEDNIDRGLDSGILILPSQTINFNVEEFEFFNNDTNGLNNFYYTSNSCKCSELSIFEGGKINDTSEEVCCENSAYLPSLIMKNTIKTQKSSTIRTSSSITFLSKTIAVKKRRLIPQINGSTRKKVQNKNLNSVVNKIKPKRKLKLRGDNYSKEYYVYRDEDYGIVDDTDDIIEGDYVHKQDDDRQTTSEVQEWAIGLIRRYLGETEILFGKEENIQTFGKSERIRSLRQRFGFSTKVR